jgi:N-acetyl-gamma-glutamyl-phosphate reductase
MIKVGIVGSAGYVAGELIRCLVNHSEVAIGFLYSNSQAGKSVNQVHFDLIGNQSLKFTSKIKTDVDVVFLCLGHGNSLRFLEQNSFSENTKVIDLSNDFRLKNVGKPKGFVYGLVEFNKSKIIKSKNIANPGCFATAIQLGLLPLAKNDLLNADIHINAVTGSTGAGQQLSNSSHFSWRNNNVSIYKAFNHQHLNEIGESIKALQNDFVHELNFLPVRGSFTRGIFASIYMNSEMTITDLVNLYKKVYQDSVFTHITEESISLKQVVNTNNCLIQLQKIDGKILITVVIDNLLKGAAGQAIQNMNLMFGIAEGTGLQLKANHF